MCSLSRLKRMAKGLSRKKWIRAGHKASVTRILSQVNNLLAAANPTSTVDTAKLTQLKLSLQEKLDTLRRLDEEVLELLTEKDDFEDEIKQAGSFKEGIYSAMVKINKWYWTAPISLPISSAPPILLVLPKCVAIEWSYQSWYYERSMKTSWPGLLSGTKST